MKRATALFVTILFFAFAACSEESAKIVRIEFPQLAADLCTDVNITFDFDEADINKLGKTLAVYKIVTRKEWGAEQYDRYLIDSFFGKNIQCQKQIYDDCVNYHYDGKLLTVYNNGSFAYFGEDDITHEPFTKSDEEVVLQAKEYLESKGLLPEGFVVGEKLTSTNTAVAYPGSDAVEQYCVGKSVIFYQRLGEYKIDGRSDIMVSITNKGIQSVLSIYNDYVHEFDIACLSHEDVQKLHPKNEGQIEYDAENLSGNPTDVIIKGVEIAYYDSPVNQIELTHIQPIYKFTGTIYDSMGNSTDYYWKVCAIPDDYLQ